MYVTFIFLLYVHGFLVKQGFIISLCEVVVNVLLVR